MAFSSIHFLFLFFPSVVILFYFVPNRWWRNAVLFLASLVFFGWADPTHLPLLLGSVLLNYVYGICIDLAQKHQNARLGRILAISGVVMNLLILVFYKYLGFVIISLQYVFPTGIDFPKLALPLGISYFTFAGISYLVDIYQNVEKAEKNPLRFGTYLIMFPKLLQGPITRFGAVKNDLAYKGYAVDDIVRGIRRLIIGLVKKVLIADNLAIAANAAFNTNPNSYGMDVAWFGLIAYALQIFFDFAGYTDMAIGLGLIFGFHLPENFNYPYISRSISDFWRRWHMSLTAWFRTYAFIPLEFARKKEKFLRQQSNILIVFLLTGLWHGSSWNFVVWGGYFGLILAIEASGFGKLLKKAPHFLQHIYTIVLILAGWIFFRITDASNWGLFYKALFGGNGLSASVTLRTLNILLYLPLLVLAVILCTPVIKVIEKKIEAYGKFARLILDLIYLVFLAVAIAIVQKNGFSAFIYTQF